LSPKIMIVAEDIAIRHQRRGGAVELLREVSFRCSPCSLTVLSGPSGSGKSSLLAVVAGLMLPAAGRVALFGQDLAVLSERQLTALRRKDVALIFQSYNLFPGLTAAENVAYGLSGPDTSGRARAALDRMGLASRADRRPNWLSGGEQQRVAVARALVRAPKVMLADEPTAALDPENTKMILIALRQIAADTGATILMISHDPAIAAEADQVLRIEAGRLAHA